MSLNQSKYYNSAKDPQTGNLKILDESHYYPFGLKHQEYSTFGFVSNPIQGVIIAPVANNPYKYKYNGKEWQDELGLGMYDMDMRQYDPAIARWVVMDPVIHHSMSPYSAFDNNPVFWADPSGAAPEIGSVFEQSGMQVASFEVQGTGTSIAAGGAEGESSSEESDKSAKAAKDPGKPKTAIGRFFDKIGKGIKSIFGGGSKGTPKGTVDISGAYSYVEPDWLNVNNTGVGLGLGVKNFKLGPLSITADISAASLTYDKNSGDLNLTVGELDLGASLGGVGLDGEINLFGTNFDDWSLGTGTIGGSLSGITRDAATGSIFSKESGWFSGTTLSSPNYPANRMTNINGQMTPMLIFGGDIRAGFFRTNVEVNLDQIMSGPMGGSGLGDDWK